MPLLFNLGIICLLLTALYFVIQKAAESGTESGVYNALKKYKEEERKAEKFEDGKC